MTEPITISVIKRGELKAGKKGAYFLVDDETDKRWICWKANLYNSFEVGSIVSIEWEASDDPTKYSDKIIGIALGTSPEAPQSKTEASKAEVRPTIQKEKVIPPKDIIEGKSFCISYSKDLAVAKIITPDQILSYAEAFYRYLIGDIQVKDEAVFKTLTEKHFKISEAQKGG